jgi:preprotein translocase subunit SecE
MASIKQIFEEVKIEYKKVKWPSREEGINVTLLVTFLSLVISVYVGVFDVLFLKLISNLASIFGG